MGARRRRAHLHRGCVLWAGCCPWAVVRRRKRGRIHDESDRIESNRKGLLHRSSSRSCGGGEMGSRDIARSNQIVRAIHEMFDPSSGGLLTQRWQAATFWGSRPRNPKRLSTQQAFGGPSLKTTRRRHSSRQQQLSRRRSSHQDAMEGREEIDSMHPKRVQSVHSLTLTAALMASRSAPRTLASAEVARLRLFWKEARPFPFAFPLIAGAESPSN